jgi:hypothetical protein
MIPIWEPLTKITVVESNSTVAKAGSTGFVIILTDDGYGYRNYWTVDLMLTRNGKKGQRSLQYRRVRTKKLEYLDIYKKDVVEEISKELLYTGLFEPLENKHSESVVLAKEPYKSKDLLDIDTWDFLGWIAACSQLISYLSTGKDFLRRITDGFPLISKPHINPFVPSDGTDLLSINPDKLINVLYFFLPDKNNKKALMKAFNDKAVRTILIEKCLRAISYGQSVYREMRKITNDVYQLWLSDLAQAIDAVMHPEKSMKKDPLLKSGELAYKPKWKARLAAPYRPRAQRIAPEPQIVQENVVTYNNFSVITSTDLISTGNGVDVTTSSGTPSTIETIELISPAPPPQPTAAEIAEHFFSHPASQQINVEPTLHINDHVAAEAEEEDYLGSLLDDLIDHEPVGGSNANNS